MAGRAAGTPRAEHLPAEVSGAEVTAAGIARLAGVGRSAVSNWRRRYPDFPAPTGGTETSPSFALAEVRQWLRSQGKLTEVPLREQLWQLLAADPERPLDALVRTGTLLLLLRDRPFLWGELSEAADADLGARLAPLLEQALDARLGPDRPVPAPEPHRIAAAAPQLRLTGALAAELGARQSFEYLLGRALEGGTRYQATTPAPLAELMALLAGPGRSVLDPAAGPGTLLRAAAGAERIALQELDPALAAVAALRLALHSDAGIRAAAGDSLRTDAFPAAEADVVLCHPPFNERDWGRETLAYDPRFEYGLPARGESELAWVQHALARLRPGGTAVLLLPPGAASRRSGRRIRAGLLRRGALRAVVALPPGAAAPHSLALHLWLLRRPDARPQAPDDVLLVDVSDRTAQSPAQSQAGLDWPALTRTVTEAWQAHGTGGGGIPGVSCAVPVLELLDDDVDLTPARHLPAGQAAEGPADLAELRRELDDTLRGLAALTPPEPHPGAGVPAPLTTVGELARAGALELRSGTGGGERMLTDHDVLDGTAPSGSSAPAEDAVLLCAGDVVLPAGGGTGAVRVVDAATAGAALGRNLHLLRPDPALVDPWFLAGFLRGSANQRQASSFATTSARLDVRRLQVPRLPLAEQRRYGARFRELAAFEGALREVARLGGRLVQGFHDGLVEGALRPE